MWWYPQRSALIIRAGLIRGLKRMAAKQVLVEKKRPATSDNPFKGMIISSHQPLKETQRRSRCAKCGSSRKYFCYTCCLPVSELQGRIPKVKLPLKIDVIKHARELDGKSTALHAAILAPDDVTVYTYPCIPDYNDPGEEVVLVYPGKAAVTMDELIWGPSSETHTSGTGKDGGTEGEASKSTSCPFRKVVFIDCTWNQTNQIYQDDRLRGLPCIIMENRKTCFWRGQYKKPDSYLATIEAIYYFMDDYRRLFQTKDEAEKGCYDDLLYFYSFMYGLVHPDGGGGGEGVLEDGDDDGQGEKTSEENG